MNGFVRQFFNLIFIELLTQNYFFAPFMITNFWKQNFDFVLAK